jgi:hypothetical protein
MANKITDLLGKELVDQFRQAMDAHEQDSERVWEALSPEDRLHCFCAVSRRIHRGELVEQGTYRHVLYDVFGFGPNSYAVAQMAGYLAIHNSIFANDHDEKLLEAFVEKLNLDVSKDDISAFLMGKLD